MSTIKLLHSWDTEYSADSVEWCPDSQFLHLFVCGTYKLDETASSNSTDSVDKLEQHRIGRLYLFSCQNIEPYLVKEQTIEMPAILDCKWCYKRVFGKIILAVADAKGKISVYQLNYDAENFTNPNLSLLTEILLPVNGEENKLSLSIDWSVRLYSDTQDQVLLAASDSKGCVTVFLLSDSKLELQHHWKSHEFEAWIVSFNHWNTSVVYTGGDDCRLCVYDIRSGTDCPISTSRLHSAGVTSMNYSPFNEFLFATGSYDENIYLWDTRQMRRYIGSASVGGGVWRLKWSPDNGRHLLAACMYNGFRVLDCLDNSKPNIIAEFNEHKSIAYGSDWCHLTNVNVKLSGFISSQSHTDYNISDISDLKLIGTCSFYDHKLCISSFVDNKNS